MKEDLTLVISSCEKFSDLWDAHIFHLNESWGDRKIKTVILTDRETSIEYENIEIFSAGKEKEMSDRIKAILPYIKTEYVLLTLDDYFITKKISNEKIEKLISTMKHSNLDYIRLFPYPSSKVKFKEQPSLYQINLEKNYAVNLYPGLWKKSFLAETISRSMNAWEYEVSLTKTAKKVNASCVMSKGKEFEILDVVRKGKMLNRAKRVLIKKNVYHGNRETIPFLQEIKLSLMFYSKELLPQKMLKFIKNYLIKKGHTFYSDGI